MINGGGNMSGGMERLFVCLHNDQQIHITVRCWPAVGVRTKFERA
jgi:hypothetical protein